MTDIFNVLTVSIAVSYGWGMRGTLLGGLRGAVLPGALLGMFLAVFSGNKIIAENFFIFAAAGASAMAFGGSETYGQTLGFIVHRNGDDYDPKKGYIAVFLKGALWQGIAGVILGIAFSAVGGKYYNGFDIIAVTALIPFVSFIGEQIFNKPYNKEEKRFPRIYFSLDRREEWGGNLLVLLMFLVFTFVRKDFYAFFFGIVGIIGGGAGFSLGMLLFDFISNPRKNGRFFAGKYNDYFSGWKAMEFTFGAVAGLAFAIYFIATKDTMLAERICNVREGEPVISSPLTPYSQLLSFVSLALVPVIKIFTIFEDKLGDYTVDHIERPVLYVFPMMLALSGCELSAKLNAFALIVFFASEKVVFERNKKAVSSRKIILGIIFGICTFASVLLCIFAEIPFIAYILMYTVFYLIADNVPLKKPKKSGISVLTYFVIQTLLLIITSIMI